MNRHKFQGENIYLSPCTLCNEPYDAPCHIPPTDDQPAVGQEGYECSMCKGVGETFPNDSFYPIPKGCPHCGGSGRVRLPETAEQRDEPAPLPDGGDVLRAPFHIDPIGNGYQLVDDDGAPLATIYKLDEARAIKAALNERAALIEVRDATQAYLESERRINGGNSVQCYKRLIEALARAK